MRALLSFALLLNLQAFAQVPSPAPAQSKGMFLKNATIHNGRGVVFDKGDLYFEEGRILFVGESGKYKPASTDFDELDLTGKHIFPGFIALDNTLGLTEIGAVRASRDHSETGEFNPSLRSIIAYNTDSDVIPTIRSNGVLLSQPSPSRGTVCGQSSIVQLDAWNWEDALVLEGDGIFLNYPDLSSFPWWMDDKQKEESKKRKMKNLDELEKFFSDSRAFFEEGEHEEENLNLLAMKGLFSGEKALYIRVDNSPKAMVDGVQFAKKHGVKRIVIRGGKEAYVVADFLKENNIPVILSKMHSNPARQEDDVDMVFKQPGMLKKEGVEFCISYDRGHTGHRNLPFVAGSAVAYGLDYEDAISSISYNAAKIVGIEKNYGSLEEGKSATLFVSSGDPLDMRTNDVIHAFIDGRSVDLNNKQKELAKKFSEKYGVE